MWATIPTSPIGSVMGDFLPTPNCFFLRRLRTDSKSAAVAEPILRWKGVPWGPQGLQYDFNIGIHGWFFVIYILCIFYVSSSYGIFMSFCAPLKTNTWHWNITIFDRKYIFKWWMFHCHVGFRGVYQPLLKGPYYWVVPPVSPVSIFSRVIPWTPNSGTPLW